jgi:chemotaxis protein methyltransferase CheR
VSAVPPAAGPDPIGEAAARLRDELGLSFEGPLRTAFEAGLADAALERGESIEATIAAVCAGDAAACDLLVELAVVHETCFYRHPDQLELVARLAAPAPGRLRLWSAGCATGEEAYSVAMALAEAGRTPGADRVLGTDVSGRALTHAAAGTYGPRTLRFTPPSWTERWLTWADAEGTRAIIPPLAAGVRFLRHNLLSPEPPPGAPFDLVLCRNVLIYFEPFRIREALVRLAASLAPGGALVLGPVELPLAEGTTLLPTAEGAGLAWAEDGGVAYLKKVG